MTSEPRTQGPEPDSGESLEEMTEQTAQIMADARKKVDRARQTLHDQLLPTTQNEEMDDVQDRDAGPGEDDAQVG